MANAFMDAIQRDPVALAALSRINSYGGQSQPMSIADAAVVVENNAARDNAAKLQAAWPSILESLKGKSPEDQFTALAPALGVDAAAKVVKSLNPQQDRNGIPTGYRWNTETGKAELIPGIPDPEVSAAKKSAMAFDNQQRMLDARENKKAKNAFIKDAQSDIGAMNLGLDKPLTFEEAKAEAERRWPSDDGESQAAPVAVKASGIAEGKTATNPKTGEKLIFRGGKWLPME